MLDIEATGTNFKKDKILEVALVELRYQYPFWSWTGNIYNSKIHYPGQPETIFAKEKMAELYKKCNELPPSRNYDCVSKEMKAYLHAKNSDPKMIMGLNASTYDVPFIFEAGLLSPASHVDDGTGKEKLVGDVHYRIFEMTGAINLIECTTGFSKDTIKNIALEINPMKLEQPKGKEHDALFDCYKQVNLMNGLIELSRRGYRV